MINDKEWNEKSLIAWNQWKKICSICGCSPEQAQILRKEVTRAFYRKLSSVMEEDHRLLTSLFSSQSDLNAGNGNFTDEYKLQSDEAADEATENDDSGNSSDEDKPEFEKKAKDGIDWANEFDLGIIEKAHSETSPKNYKDLVWIKIKESGDPELKIIRGMLIGKLGIINEIAERFLRVNCPTFWDQLKEKRNTEQRENNKGYRFTIESADEPIDPNDPDGGTLGEEISAPLPPAYLDDSEKECLRYYFQDLFSKENAAIFLVFLTQQSSTFESIKFDAPELKEYLGLSSKSAIYDRLNNVILPKIKALPSEALDTMSIPGAIDFLIFLMFNQIKTEKRANHLLQIVSKEINNHNQEEINHD